MSEYLSEEEQIAKMKSWWDDNGTFLIGSIVIAILAIGGWRYYDGYRVDQSHQASRAYAAYRAADEAGKSAAFDEIAQKFNGSAYHAFGLLDQAQAASRPLAGARIAVVASENPFVAIDVGNKLLNYLDFFFGQQPLVVAKGSR